MKKLHFILICLVSLTFFAAGCDDDNVTEPVPETGGGDLLVDRLAVAVVPGGSETIVVQAVDQGGVGTGFTAELDDPAVAQLALTATDIVVTGTDIGRTVLTIVDSEGRERRIPVNVYDPFAVDFGEIIVKFHREFGPARGFGSLPLMGDRRFYFHHPLFDPADDRWYALGSHLLGLDEDPQTELVMLVARVDADADPVHPPLVIPESYLYDMYLSVYDGDSRTSFFWPVPPDGYRALGVVATTHPALPEEDGVACVRRDLTHQGELVGDDLAAATNHYSDGEIHQFYQTLPLAEPPHEAAYLPARTFSYLDSEHDEHHPCIQVLKLPLPSIAESEDQVIIPRLTGYQAPPDQSLPTELRAILTPFYFITDPAYPDHVDWQLDNSPFYRLECDVYYKLKYFNYNQTSAEQENRIEIVSGTSREECEQYWEETGVSITRESGVMIGSETYGGTVSSRTATNVSRSLGFATMTNIQEFYEEHTTTTVFTPPGKAAAMWQKFNRFTLKRHVGTETEIVSIYEMGVNEFITDDYPDDGDKARFIGLSDARE